MDRLFLIWNYTNLFKKGVDLEVVKNDKLWNFLFVYAVVVSVVMLIELGAILLGVDIIDDLKATANGYESDRNLCRSQLDSLTHELERWQNE